MLQFFVTCILLFSNLSGLGEAFSLNPKRSTFMTSMGSIDAPVKILPTRLDAVNRPKTKKPRPDIDLSEIESRDMTREEMFELNRMNESTMNKELVGMTVVSVLFSLPIFYLCWVAYFSE